MILNSKNYKSTANSANKEFNLIITNFISRENVKQDYFNALNAKMKFNVGCIQITEFIVMVLIKEFKKRKRSSNSTNNMIKTEYQLPYRHL